LSMHKDRRYAMRMLRAGALGYLLKECASEELVEAVRETARGAVYVSPQLTSSLVETLLAGQSEVSSLGDLSTRQREILQLIAEGHTSKGIALKLGIALRTVEYHRRHLMLKLEVKTIAGLTKAAMREGLA
jgi:DNA-binding NarL/FixJ family response regulator